MPETSHSLDQDAQARRILLGTTIADKLAPVTRPGLPPPAGVVAPFEPPDFPGRPPELRRGGKAVFPSDRVLGDATARGHVLHFFANHELLAVELMALALLRFPDAPGAFRDGLARTIADEQSHLRLYLDRMAELGVRLGELPVSDFFWNRLRHMRSPLDYVMQMSLTFEQANLDYSIHYRDAVARHGDSRTAEILDRVYRDEIGHVKHGVVWFNRWRGDTALESDWDAYRRLLPPPLTPRRARGIGFAAEARRAAGLSEIFIEELAIHSGSRGRPPVVWLFNPNCEAENARGRPGGTETAPARDHRLDLAPLLLFLARDSDLVVLDPPRREWLQELTRCGFRLAGVAPSAQVSAAKIGGCEPWGWSPNAHAMLQPLAARIVPRRGERGAWQRALLERAEFDAAGLAQCGSKAWAATFLHAWLLRHPEAEPVFGSPSTAGTLATTAGDAHCAIAALHAHGARAVVKAPWGTSGRGVRRVATPSELTAPLVGWIRNTVEAQGGILIEPWLDRVHDVSMQIEVGERGATRLLAVREFCTDTQWQYRGTVLGRDLWQMRPEAKRLLNAALPAWRRLARDAGAALAQAGYRGPAGIDAMVWRDASGALRLKPLSELNLRWTMGRVALALERHIAPGVHAAWVVAPLRADAVAAGRTHPPQFVDTPAGRRIREGIVFTTDPVSARAVVTALVAGDRALASPLGAPAAGCYQNFSSTNPASSGS